MKAARFIAVLALMVGITFGQSSSRSSNTANSCRNKQCEHCCINGECGTSDKCNSTGTLIGSIIGVVVGVALIAGLVYYCWRRSQQPQMAPGQIVVVQPQMAPQMMPGRVVVVQPSQYPPQQMQQYPPGQYIYSTGQYYPAPPQQPCYGAPGQPPVYGQTPPVMVGQPVYPPPPA